jgi:ribonucleoside-diphosphate reductase beta chain
MEPILDAKNDRIRLFPIKYQEIWDMYNTQKAAFWVAEEVSLTDDLKDWETLDADERHYILLVLSFFAGSDFIVNENLDKGFVEQVAVPEYRILLHFQEMMEDIHSTMYQILINTYITDETQREQLFNGIKTYDSIRAKAEWARKWIAEGNFVQRLVAFACVEGILFSSSFASIFWLKKRGLMPGLAHSNQLIARDEGMHRDTAVMIYRNYITNKLEKSRVKSIIKEAVAVECEFVEECLPYKLKGMNSELMCQYVKFVADHLCDALIDEKIYNVENPFSWMNLISLEGKTNFFEKRVSEYAKNAVITDKSENVFELDADF